MTNLDEIFSTIANLNASKYDLMIQNIVITFIKEIIPTSQE